jgi:hypothetical protein
VLAEFRGGRGCLGGEDTVEHVLTETEFVGCRSECELMEIVLEDELHLKGCMRGFLCCFEKEEF